MRKVELVLTEDRAMGGVMRKEGTVVLKGEVPDDIPLDKVKLAWTWNVLELREK